MNEAKKIIQELTGVSTDDLIDQAITLPIDIILKAMMRIANRAFNEGISGNYQEFQNLLDRKWD